MIHKARTVIVLNEGTLLKSPEDISFIRKALRSHHCKKVKNQSNFISLIQIYCFGFRIRSMSINTKRILYFYPA